MPKAKRDAAPLRGEAAWQAARKEMAKRNDDARERAAAKRAEHNQRLDDCHRARIEQQKPM